MMSKSKVCRVYRKEVKNFVGWDSFGFFFLAFWGFRLKLARMRFRNMKVGCVWE